MQLTTEPSIGLTAHDRDLVIGGLVYRAAPGMTPSAVTRSASLDADSMDVTGALTSSAISEGDLLAGRWDGARVSLFAMDWRDPGETVALGEGVIGAVETRGDALTAELRGAAAALERPVVEETSPECRAELGDGELVHEAPPWTRAASEAARVWTMGARTRSKARHRPATSPSVRSPMVETWK